MTEGSHGERADGASPGARGARLDPPVIAATEARVAVDDVVSIQRLTFTSRGARVLFVGDVTALFAALGGVPLSARTGLRERDGPPGDARIVSGRVRIAGRDVATGAHVELTGVAPLDPPLPPGWTFEEYLAWSARLSGARPRLALELARATSDRLGVGPLRSRHLAGLGLAERRSLVICAAVLSSPRVLVAEAPLAGLDGAGAALVMSTQ